MADFITVNGRELKMVYSKEEKYWVNCVKTKVYDAKKGHDLGYWYAHANAGNCGIVDVHKFKARHPDLYDLFIEITTTNGVHCCPDMHDRPFNERYVMQFTFNTNGNEGFDTPELIRRFEIANFPVSRLKHAFLNWNSEENISGAWVYFQHKRVAELEGNDCETHVLIEDL